MTQTLYNDFYMRVALGDSGLVPRQDVTCMSPDIIPYQTDVVADPQTFFSGNYGQDVGKTVLVNQKNYFYGRSKNLGGANNTGTLSLYWSKASLLNWPYIWKDQGLKTDSGVSDVPISAAANGDVGVTASPLVWTPGPISGDHYCMIGQVKTTAHPNDIPNVQNITDFASWIGTSPGMCWRNLTLVSGDTPTWQKDVYYEQGATGQDMYVFLDCQNVPNGCSVGLSCGSAGPTPAIAVQKTDITSFPSETVGVKTSIPANFSGNITVSFWQNGKPIPSNFSIELRAVYVLAEDHELHGKIKHRHLAELNIPNHLVAKDHVGPQPAMVLGQYAFQTTV